MEIPSDEAENEEEEEEEDEEYVDEEVKREDMKRKRIDMITNIMVAMNKKQITLMFEMINCFDCVTMLIDDSSLMALVTKSVKNSMRKGHFS